MKHLITITLLLALFSAGCRDTSKPKDLPKLYPCTITIMQGGVPLAEAAVELAAVGEGVKYRSSSFTDASGRAVMSTYGFPGVPAGKYKVIVKKTLVDGTVEYRTVEAEYSDAETTPYEIEVTGKGKSAATFDVGKAIKIELPQE